MGQFLGYVALGSNLSGSVLTRDGSNIPKDASPAPTYRIYGPAGLMTNGTGSLSLKDPSSGGGPITGATNASPIVIASVGHGLTTGTRVTISGVGGNTNANGDFNITLVDADHFSLNGTTGNAPYTTGGTWHTSGLYNVNIPILAANGFVQGQNYTLFVQATVGANNTGDVNTFVVV